MAKAMKHVIRDLSATPIKAWGQIKARNYDMQNTILMVCTGRGGSTWLAEIIQTIPGYLTLFEPINPRFNPTITDFGFEEFTYIGTKEVDKQKSDYIYDLLTGRVLSPYMIALKQFKLSQALSFQGYGVKMIRGHLFLRWLVDQYPIPTLFMTRHPCAVVASQLSHLGWAHFDGTPLQLSDNLMKDYPHLVSINEAIRTREEELAFIWAMKTFIPLNSPKPHPWHLFTYEDLVENGTDEIDRLFSYLNKPVPAQAYQQLRVASGSTLKDSPFAQGNSALRGWRKNLTTAQIDSILRIVHDVGIDFYTEDLYPDHEKLGIER